MKKIFVLFVAALSFLGLSGCGIGISKTSTPPQAVTELSAAAVEGKIVLNWKDPADSDLLGIKIYNAQESESRSVSFKDGILVGKGIQHYEISNLQNGKSYSFRVSAVNVDLLESDIVTTEAVTFIEKVIEKEVEVEVEVVVNKYVCPVDNKEFDTLEEAASCCGVQIEYVDKIVEVEKPVYKYICPKDQKEFETAEEAAECCGVQIETVEKEVEKLVTKFVCPRDGKEWDSSEEAIACCGPEISIETKYVCPKDLKEFETAEEAASCCGVQIEYVDKIVEVEKPVYKYICPKDQKEFETAEEAAECCGVQIETVEKEVEKLVTKYVCPRDGKEWDSCEEAIACCGPEINNITKYICPIDGKEFDSAEEAMACCGEKLVFRTSVNAGNYTVYHMQQNLAGGTAIANYSLCETENGKQTGEVSSINFFKKEYSGFEAVSLAQQGSDIYVFYNRKLITYTFETGIKGNFEDGETVKTVTGLFGTEVRLPGDPSGNAEFIKWNDSSRKEVPSVFGDRDITFIALWHEDFVKIDFAESGTFYISTYETTYIRWYEVYKWALENGYSFQSKGKEGSAGKPEGAEPTMNRKLPVTNISWRDAVVWCNAASEKDGLTPVYEYDGQVLRSAQTSSVKDGEGKAENSTINSEADGYRLPTVAEWIYAAAGGEEYLYSGSDNPDEVAWYGTGTGSGGNSKGSAQDVQSLAPNGYGLYDMSGNVWEWCQDNDSGENPLYKVMCGGSYWGVVSDSMITNSQSRSPSKMMTSAGFRIVRQK